MCWGEEERPYHAAMATPKRKSEERGYESVRGTREASLALSGRLDAYHKSTSHSNYLRLVLVELSVYMLIRYRRVET